MLITKSDKIMILGSCFATEMGKKLQEQGYDVCLNPFGTLFNPVSICNSIARMRCGIPFSESDCIEMGAKAGKICSFYHHTSFAREKAEDFLEVANQALAKASDYWKQANIVILTFGTAFVWRFISSGEIVSNCLKRPGYEFTHEMLGVNEYSTLLDRLIAQYPDKNFILTVSPIRHLGYGAHSNQLSKATLHLAIEPIVQKYPNAEYFPSYEILLDDLRDYKWYAPDKVHPSAEAVEYIWEKFKDSNL